MGLLLPLILCALAACYEARSPVGLPPPPLPPNLRLVPRGCNDSDVLAVSGFALEDINKDRKDGYVLSLNRVSDAREHRQADLGSLFYLTLDVLETGCHVLSKKSWKDCGARILHESVYGQCKALFYINKPRRILYTHAYNCTLRPVSRRSIHHMCPDCPSPSPIDMSDPNVMEAVTKSLEKYNNESALKQYSLVKVTKASSQWVFGPGYFVEYLIRESTCTKRMIVCTLQMTYSEPVALCKGSLSKRGGKEFVSVSCDFFESQDSPPGVESSSTNQKPTDLPEVKDLQKESSASTDSPPKAAQKGSVQRLPDLDDEKPKDSEVAGPVEVFPVHLDLTANPSGEPLDISFLFMGPEKKVIDVLPFPEKDRRSSECPGPAQHTNKLILPP
ncbi:fetuin-B-like [Erinaceus europaeus]|uniref:Fetuin-B-like n=1 Tax=Erinaceus europaeus TaxID=9365 RepID=A0A1S2ZIC5_ERIEU|nr:fetuin-B-like [Erinaceus europaeus]